MKKEHGNSKLTYHEAALREEDVELTGSENDTPATMTNGYTNRYTARLAHFGAAARNRDFKPTDTENVIVIGKTGSGKTSIISLLLGRDVGVGHGIDSKTAKTMQYDFDLPAEYGDRKIKLIDTRGVLDTKASLKEVIGSLVDTLTGRFYYVNTIMLILECARFTEETQHAWKGLVEAFGLDDVERSTRLLVVVTKVEHLPMEERDMVRRNIIDHPLFRTFNISVEYLEENTIEVFAGQSEGANPLLEPAYRNLREQSKAKLLRALAQNNSHMTISNDFLQKFTNVLTHNVRILAANIEELFRT